MRPPLIVPAVPPRGPLAHHFADIGSLADQEAIPVLGIIAVSVPQRVDSIGLDQLGLGDQVFEPAVVGLAGELPDPQGHRDGDAVGGELAHERVELSPGRFAWDR